MTRSVAVAAVDLGASAGRVIVGRLGDGPPSLVAVHRFANEPVRVRDTLHWDILALYRGVLDGLRAAGPVAGIGIDSWAVDYGLIDVTGALLGNPVHYRDPRTHGVRERLAERLGEQRLYATTGLQQLPFNTLYQLAAVAGTPLFAAAHRVLLIADLIAYWLTGEIGAERTNASTTQLYDLRRGAWAADLIADAGLPQELFPPLREPGTRIGPVLPDLGLPGSPEVLAVGSHDTASAVVGVPARGERFAYVSCGTWALAGLELDRPVLTEASRLANFTNETGVDGRVRYLRNVMGLWLLQESLRTWRAAGRPVELSALLAAAAAEPAFGAVIDPDDPVFLPPGDMPSRIAAWCRRTGQPPPGSPAAATRCVLDSLALTFRRTLRRAAELAGRDIEVVHVVGGGARNGLLCQLTADACGLPVLAGPVEATALGNVLVQGRALGAIAGDLDELRVLAARAEPVVRYEPRGDESAWAAAERRLPLPAHPT